MTAQSITTEDLRRAARFCIGLYEDDTDTSKRVAFETAKLDRWAELAMACALMTRIVLTKVDQIDDGAIALWLHAAVEQITDDGDAWWIEDGRDGE